MRHISNKSEQTLNVAKTSETDRWAGKNPSHWKASFRIRPTPERNPRPLSARAANRKRERSASALQKTSRSDLARFEIKYATKANTGKTTNVQDEFKTAAGEASRATRQPKEADRLTPISKLLQDRSYVRSRDEVS